MQGLAHVPILGQYCPCAIHCNGPHAGSQGHTWWRQCCSAAAPDHLSSLVSLRLCCNPHSHGTQPPGPWAAGQPLSWENCCQENTTYGASESGFGCIASCTGPATRAGLQAGDHVQHNLRPVPNTRGLGHINRAGNSTVSIFQKGQPPIEASVQPQPFTVCCVCTHQCCTSACLQVTATLFSPAWRGMGRQATHKAPGCRGSLTPAIHPGDPHGNIVYTCGLAPHTLAYLALQGPLLWQLLAAGYAAVAV